MSLGPEFDLIARYFGQPFADLKGLALEGAQARGVGDDAAVLAPLPAGQQLVVAADMLVESQHYFPEVDPASLGHKALAVNLSDLAAMGASPLGFTLSLGLREIRPDWLEAFSQGLRALAERTNCPLLGGDTVRVGGSASEVISVSILGLVPTGAALLRSGLRPGDSIWVSGSLGDGSQAVLERRAWPKLNRPEPRLGLGLRLRGLATAAIDVSDGLVSELLHLAEQSSQLGGQALQIQVCLEALADCRGDLLRQAEAQGSLSRAETLRRAAESGDEYELLFGIPAGSEGLMAPLSASLGLPLTRIGRVSLRERPDQPAVTWHDQNGQPLAPHETPGASFDHFQPH